MIKIVKWVAAEDCDPPHGLDMHWAHDADKVNMLAEAFITKGFDMAAPALIGYPLNGKIQLLSGTHRHRAALLTNTKLPVMLWLRSDVETAWGNLDKWIKVIEDISVSVLETWTREDLAKHKPKC